MIKIEEEYYIDKHLTTIEELEEWLGVEWGEDEDWRESEYTVKTYERYKKIIENGDEILTVYASNDGGIKYISL